MKRALVLGSGVVTMGVLSAALAFGQAPKPASCGQANAPQMVEGEVVRVDTNAGKVTVKAKDGTTHEFQASKETAQTMKPGDKVEAKLRETPKC